MPADFCFTDPNDVRQIAAIATKKTRSLARLTEEIRSLFALGKTPADSQIRDLLSQYDKDDLDESQSISSSGTIKFPAQSLALHQGLKRRSIEHYSFEFLCKYDVSRVVVDLLRNANSKLHVLAERAAQKPGRLEFQQLAKKFVEFDSMFHRIAIDVAHNGETPKQYLRFLESRFLLMLSGVHNPLVMRDVASEHDAIIDAVASMDEIGVRLALEKHLASAWCRWSGSGQFHYIVEIEQVQPANLLERHKGSVFL